MRDGNRSRQDAVVLVYRVGPDILPAFVPSGSFISELHTLVTSDKVVVAPVVVPVAVLSCTDIFNDSLSGDGGYTFDLV